MKGNHFNAVQMNAAMIRITTFRWCVELSNLVLYEQALLGHDDLLTFDNEMNSAVNDYIEGKNGIMERIEKMHKDTGLSTKIIGSNVIVVDDTKEDVDGNT